jgi:hypothetical protein
MLIFSPEGIVNWSTQTAGKLLIVVCCLTPLGLRADDPDVTFKNTTGSNYRISTVSAPMGGHKFDAPKPYTSSPYLALSWGEKKGDAITAQGGDFLLKAGKEWKPAVKGHDPAKANLKVIYLKVTKESKASREHPESVILAFRVYMGKAKLFLENASLTDNADVADVFKLNDPDPGSFTITPFNYAAPISGDQSTLPSR